jgi:hypothetical protein
VEHLDADDIIPYILYSAASVTHVYSDCKDSLSAEGSVVAVAYWSGIQYGAEVFETIFENLSR